MFRRVSASFLSLTPNTTHPHTPISLNSVEKINFIRIFLYFGKMSKKIGFSSVNLQILEAFPIFLGGAFGPLFWGGEPFGPPVIYMLYQHSLLLGLGFFEL